MTRANASLMIIYTPDVPIGSHEKSGRTDPSPSDKTEVSMRSYDSNGSKSIGAPLFGHSLFVSPPIARGRRGCVGDISPDKGPYLGGRTHIRQFERAIRPLIDKAAPRLIGYDTPILCGSTHVRIGGGAR